MDEPKSLEIPGPEDAYLLIEPRPHCYQWRIRNDSLRHLKGLRLEIVEARSFNATKAAFRDATKFNVQWGPILELGSGHLSEPEIFVRFDGDKFGFGNSTGGHLLHWPTGDPSTAQRWLLTMRIRGLAQEWPIELDLQWTLGTKTLELIEHAPKRPEEPGSPLHDPNVHLSTDSFTFFKEPRSLGGNPYPPDSSLWHGFEQATYEAKKELDSLWAEYTRRYALATAHSEVLALILEARVKRLDIIAECMLQTFVADEDTGRRYEDWLADLMRAEQKDVLDLVREEMPHYGEYFNNENFTQTLLLKQQDYKEKCDSKVIQLIRDRRAAHEDASSPLEPTTSSGSSATTNPTPDEMHVADDKKQASQITFSLADPGGPTIDARGNMWLKYQARFEANLESLEAMAARSDPLHLPLDEQDAQRFARNAAKQRFDELAEIEYRQWVDSGLPHETFSPRLSELREQVLTASAEVWSFGSNVLRHWYEKNCRLPADDELSGKVSRWEQRARTTELVCHLSRDRGVGLTEKVAELATLISEEDQKVPSFEDKRRLRVHLYDVGHRFYDGYTGDFLERSRLAITSVGFQLGPPNGISPLEFCLRMLFRELVCEREPLLNPQVARLNSEQVARYLWAAHSGTSTTPEDGEVRNPCEALRWYCQRLMGLLDSPDVVLRLTRVLPKSPIQESGHGRDATKRRGRRRNQGRRDAIHSAIAKHGSAWRDHLSDIFAELEANDVPLGDFQGRKIDLGDGQNVKVWKWTDLDFAQGDQLKQIVDTLRKYTD